MQELAFERVNRHRALAELVIYNRNWLPWWLTTSIISDFCDQAERWLRGESLPPLPVRLWWAYKHWRFKKGVYQTSRRDLQEHHRDKAINPMAQSKATGEFFKPRAVIPLAPAQEIKFIPVLPEGHRVEVTDESGNRRSVVITPTQIKQMTDSQHGLIGLLNDSIIVMHTDDGDFQIDATQVRSAIRENVSGVTTCYGLPIARSTPIPNSLGDYPRPNCPKCHTPHPELSTPLDPKSPSGWGDSFFTCSNYDCRHKWKWKKVYPLLEENKDRAGTKTGAKLKGTDIPFHLFKQAGCTVEQANEAIRKFANVAGLKDMSLRNQLQIAEIIQTGEHKNTCNFNGIPLAKLTPSERLAQQRRTNLEAEHRREIWESNNR